MQSVDYATLVQAVKPNSQISEAANQLANALILELRIPSGQGLAVFLGVPDRVENHKALRRWVQQQLAAETDYVYEEMQHLLQKKLCDLLPLWQMHDNP